ncbi:MAG TPA: enoyl-CoA hydratase [Casimicrobiaceae bacterium]|nr:enoyl-CoA hydratase [Casimicrobiaceae bacterium]
MTNDTVLVTRNGAIATLTLNRPAALNALDNAMVDAMFEATSSIARDDNIRVVVLRGAGKHFMAGGDIRLFAESLDSRGAQRTTEFRALIDGVHATIELLARMPQPVIAGVQGAVAGFGLSLTNACDLVYACDDAYFASAYLQLGVTPDGGGTYWLPRLVGARKAAEIMLLGDRFDAATALSLGIVNRVVAAAELDATLTKAARRIAEGPVDAVRNLKRLLRESMQRTLSEQLHAEGDSFSRCAGTDDFVEGVRAFLEKRSAAFGANR